MLTQRGLGTASHLKNLAETWDKCCVVRNECGTAQQDRSNPHATLTDFLDDGVWVGRNGRRNSVRRKKKVKAP